MPFDLIASAMFILLLGGVFLGVRALVLDWIYNVKKMKIDRQRVFDKYGGKCAYTGKPLSNDWEIEHIVSRLEHRLRGSNNHNDFDNLYPCEKIINHYKRALTLEEFRDRIKTLHLRLEKLPQKTISPRTQRRKEYLLKVAELFGVTRDNPFEGVFYFERQNK